MNKKISRALMLVPGGKQGKPGYRNVAIFVVLALASIMACARTSPDSPSPTPIQAVAPEQLQCQDTGLSGEGHLYKLVSITQVDSGLEVRLAAKMERIEVVEAPHLITPSVIVPGTYGLTPEGDLIVKFPSVPSSLADALLEIPNASVELSASTSSPLNSKVILGPEGQRYAITRLVSDQTSREFQIHYQPEGPSHPAVKKAVLRTTQKSVNSTGLVASYGIPKQQFQGGVIYFPLDGAALANQEDAVLEVVLFQDMVTDCIALQEVER